ncbi:MAG TPA: hypothetical protein VL769_08600 [Acidimicrobiia bacterium]|nr:hypothetical protein [Acidimicrobiia bacterium]
MSGRGRISAIALIVGAFLAVGACGGSGSGISSAAGAQLQLRVAAIRASAAVGDRSGAESQLAQLRADVLQFRAADKLDDSAAGRILSAAQNVETKLALLGPSPVATTTTSTTTTTRPEPSTKKGHDKPKGHGKGD